MAADELVEMLMKALQAQAARQRGYLSDAMARALAQVAIATLQHSSSGLPVLTRSVLPQKTAPGRPLENCAGTLSRSVSPCGSSKRGAALRTDRLPGERCL